MLSKMIPYCSCSRPSEDMVDDYSCVLRQQNASDQAVIPVQIVATAPPTLWHHSEKSQIIQIDLARWSCLKFSGTVVAKRR
jgi:hypothetical protein